MRNYAQGRTERRNGGRRHETLAMKSRLLPLLAVMILGITATALPADATAVRRFRIEPSTTKVIVGHARLSVEPLVREDGGLGGGYKVEVSPIAVGNEAGKLSVKVSDDDLRKLAGGQSVQFTGQAVSTAGNTSEVYGTATPTAGGGDGGALRIHIASKKGKLVFNTTYHLER